MLLSSKMLYGGDYNPEQWSPAVWQEDVSLMKQAGVNLATVGVFSWAQLEPQPGQYTFDWLDTVLDLLHHHGIGVCLATATASPPPWLAHLYPDSLPVNADGVKLYPGARQHYCPHSADYRRHAAALVEQIAKRYSQHPALVLWHINNEYACHVAECFCEESASAFRIWLENKYTTIDALNQAWGTSFWSQRYGSWSEIHPPRRAPASINPGQMLDWRRFCSDSLLDLFEMEKNILRRYSSAPITTNFMGYFKPLDYWKWADLEDIVSLDCYPDPASSTPAIDMAFNADLMRSLKHGEPWLLMEQAVSAVNWRQINAPKRPGQMRLFSLQAVARGANGILFFQWRQSRFGAEKFHSALLPHGGSQTRTFREVSQLGAELNQLAQVIPARNTASVAIVLDYENWWALELDSKPAALSYLELLRHQYACLYNANIAVDFVHPGSDLSQYKLVIVPNLYLTRQSAAQNLTRYVDSGGSLLTGFFSGIVDENDHVHPGAYPAPLRGLLGLRVDEFAPLQPGETVELSFQGVTHTASLWTEMITLAGADALAVYRSGYAAGQPAITRHKYGKGAAYYVGTHLSSAAQGNLYQDILHDLELRPALSVPSGVEACWRGEFVFLLNHSNAPAAIHLEGKVFHNPITGEMADPVIQLAALDGVILQEVTLSTPGDNE